MIDSLLSDSVCCDWSESKNAVRQFSKIRFSKLAVRHEILPYGKLPHRTAVPEQLGRVH